MRAPASPFIDIIFDLDPFKVQINRDRGTAIRTNKGCAHYFFPTSYFDARSLTALRGGALIWITMDYPRVREVLAYKAPSLLGWLAGSRKSVALLQAQARGDGPPRRHHAGTPHCVPSQFRFPGGPSRSNR
jgi:hypothetical protein